MSTTKANTMGMLMLKRSYQLVWCGKKHEIRDNARNNLVVFAGTYRQCVAEAKRRGVWYS
jgi:hypothetical protein